jgi:predicted RND superfamily exporter protein
MMGKRGKLMNVRDRIEKGFEKYADFIFHHRWLTLAAMSLIIASLLSQIPKITIDTSTEGFLHETDPALVAYNQFRDQFGRDEVIIIALETKDVFEIGFLELLKNLHQDLESGVPHVDDITSLINARNTRGGENELIVEDLLEDWPDATESIEEIRLRALSNPVYKNLLLSEDGRFTTIIIRTHTYAVEGGKEDILEGFDEEAPVPQEEIEAKSYLTDEENSETVFAVKNLVNAYRQKGLTLYLAGSPVVTHFLKQSMMTDMRRFLLMATIAVGICLFAMFRRISGVVIPLVVVILSLLSTIGIMALTGFSIKVPTQILPSFLLAVGVGTSVHILAIFFYHFQEHKDKAAAISYAMGHSGLAIVMTNITTAAGLMSFSTAEVAPIADLGLFAGIGVLLAFFFTVTLLPALLSVIPIKKEAILASLGKTGRMDSFLEGIARFSTSFPKSIVFVSLVILAGSIVAATGIRFSHYPLYWFPETDSIRVATSTIDSRLNGSINLEIVIDTGMENGLYDPDFLHRLDEAAAHMETIRYDDVYIGKAWSMPTILKEIHQALNENRSEFYAIPDNRDLVAQELLLFENSGSDDLEDFVDSQFSKVRLTMKAPFTDAVKYSRLIEEVDTYFAEMFPQANVASTGMIPLLARVMSNSIFSLAKSYGIALAIISVMMILLIGRLRIGMLSMVPNLTPILLTMGVIYLFHFPMDLFTMLVASIAIGLAVDDTIHFMHNFRRYYEQTGNPKEAVRLTMISTGRAMLVTTVVLAIGFFILTFSRLNNIQNFGILTGFTIITALLADYLLAPALMVLVSPVKAKGEDKGGRLS